MTLPTTQELKRALELTEQIEALKAELNEILGGEAAAPATVDMPGRPGRKRQMSAAGRKAIAAAQKKRWAKLKGALVEKPARKPKSKFSPAVRKAQAARMKAMWKARKAAGKTSL